MLTAHLDQFTSQVMGVGEVELTPVERYEDVKRVSQELAEHYQRLHELTRDALSPHPLVPGWLGGVPELQLLSAQHDGPARFRLSNLKIETNTNYTSQTRHTRVYARTAWLPWPDDDEWGSLARDLPVGYAALVLDGSWL